MASMKRDLPLCDPSHLKRARVGPESQPAESFAACNVRVVLNPADCDIGYNQFPFFSFRFSWDSWPFLASVHVFSLRKNKIKSNLQEALKGLLIGCYNFRLFVFLTWNGCKYILTYLKIKRKGFKLCSCYLLIVVKV